MTAFDDLLTWRESSTSGVAIAAALDAADRAPDASLEALAAADRIVITGAGSSYYLAQAVAAVARASLRRPVLAAPLSELILRPAGVLVGGEPVVIISRSGSTSEAVTVAQRMRSAGHPTIAVTCRAEQPARDGGGRDARLARGRRGGDRHDPVLREHARAAARGRRPHRG